MPGNTQIFEPPNITQLGSASSAKEPGREVSGRHMPKHCCSQLHRPKSQCQFCHSSEGVEGQCERQSPRGFRHLRGGGDYKTTFWWIRTQPWMLNIACICQLKVSCAESLSSSIIRMNQAPPSSNWQLSSSAVLKAPPINSTVSVFNAALTPRPGRHSSSTGQHKSLSASRQATWGHGMGAETRA